MKSDLVKEYLQLSDQLKLLAYHGKETSQEYERITAEMDTLWSRMSNDEQNEAEPHEPGVK